MLAVEAVPAAGWRRQRRLYWGHTFGELSDGQRGAFHPRGNRTGLGHMGTLLTVDVVFEVIGEALAQKENVTIMNFGRFTTKDRSVRTGRNPRTGEAP